MIWSDDQAKSSFLNKYDYQVRSSYARSLPDYHNKSPSHKEEKMFKENYNTWVGNEKLEQRKKKQRNKKDKIEENVKKLQKCV